MVLLLLEVCKETLPGIIINVDVRNWVAQLQKVGQGLRGVSLGFFLLRALQHKLMLVGSEYVSQTFTDESGPMRVATVLRQPQNRNSCCGTWQLCKTSPKFFLALLLSMEKEVPELSG